MMIKRFAIAVSFVLLIAAGLFFRTILDALSGMSVLDMMKQAVSFVLHVIVVSILGYAVYFVVNEIALPIARTFQWKQRRQRRQIRGRRTPATAHHATSSKRGRDLGLLWLINQLGHNYDAQSQHLSKRNQ